jgi:hypothetical protein
MSNSDVGGSDRQDDLENQLSLVEDEVRRIPTKEHVEHVERRVTRFGKMAVIASLIISILAVAGCVTLAIIVAGNEAENALTREGVESLKAANEELRDRGLPEIPLPAEGESINADAMAAAAAAILYDQISNDPQFKGPEGDAGESGTPGAPGDPCEPVEPGCRGPGGPSGEEGQDGEDGQPGSDPPCLSEPAQCRGADGRGVHDFALQPNGDLFVFYSNAVDEAVFLGNIMGPAGPQGPPGDTLPVCPADFPVQNQRTFLTGLLPGESETVVVCTQG